jgi:hypothetical protein
MHVLWRFMRTEAFAEVQHPLVILIEMGAAGQGAERDVLVNVGVARRVGHRLGLDPGPGRRGDDLARLHLDVAERDLVLMTGSVQVMVVDAGLLGQRGPGLVRDFTTGFRRHAHHRIADEDVLFQGRHALGHARHLHRAVHHLELFVLFLRIPVDALDVVADLDHQRADGDVLLVGVGKVALDHLEQRHGLARDRIALAFLPVLDLAEGLGQFERGVMLHRQGDDILARAEVFFGQRREGLGDVLEDLPVGHRLPARRYRLGQRMHEGMHVGGIEVVLLVPGRGRQDDVGVGAGGIQAEVDVDHQVQLADRRFVVPLDQLVFASGTGFLQHAVLRAEQVLEEVLVALGGAADQVGAPDEQVARPVDRIVRVGECHIQRAILELADHVLGDACLVGGAGFLGFGNQIERVGIPVRRGRQPAHADRGDVVVGQRVALVLALAGGRGEIVAAQGFIAPLVGVEIPVGGGVHVTRRTLPVEREGDRCPAGLRAQFFLAHVVCPATTGLTHATADVQQVHHAAVHHVVVVPVVDRGAHDHHGFAMRLGCVVGEFAAGALDVGSLHAGDFFSPGRGVGNGGILEVLGDVAATQSTVDTVLGNLHVEHGGDQDFLAVGQLQLACGDVAVQQVTFTRLEVREPDRDHGILAVDARQFGQNFLLAGSVLGQQVPLAFFAPAEADRAVRHDKGLGLFVVDDGFPVGIVGLAQGAVQVGSAQAAVGHIAFAMLAQHHLNRQVGVLAGIFREIGVLLVDVELFQRDVAHRQEGGGIGTRIDRHPQVGCLAILGVVGCHRDDLGALVTHLGNEVGIRRTRGRQAGAADDDVGGVVPVGRFRHVGLLAPGLGGRGRQVAIPVVEGTAGAADQRQVARAGSVGNLRHRRNRRETENAVRAIFLDGMDVGRGDDFLHFFPVGAHEATQATHGGVFLALVFVSLNRRPCLDRVLSGLALGAVQVKQTAADQRVLDALRAVQIPGERRATLATARLMVRQVFAGTRIVGLLHFKGNQAVLDENLPRTATGAVHAVRGANHLVMRPAMTVGIFPLTIFVGDDPVVVGEGLLGFFEKLQTVEKVTHFLLS